VQLEPERIDLSQHAVEGCLVWKITPQQGVLAVRLSS
jgi:hypothetical protein